MISLQLGGRDDVVAAVKPFAETRASVRKNQNLLILDVEFGTDAVSSELADCPASSTWTRILRDSQIYAPLGGRHLRQSRSGSVATRHGRHGADQFLGSLIGRSGSLLRGTDVQTARMLVPTHEDEELKAIRPVDLWRSRKGTGDQARGRRGAF